MGPSLSVAVGTIITDRPPHRSVRARLRIRLLRRMSGVEACIGIGVQNAGRRNPPVQDWSETFPTHRCALAAAVQFRFFHWVNLGEEVKRLTAVKTTLPCDR